MHLVVLNFPMERSMNPDSKNIFGLRPPFFRRQIFVVQALSFSLIGAVPFLLLALTGSCSPDRTHQPLSPTTEKTNAGAEGEVTYENVRPIFIQRCSSCHGKLPGIPDWSKEEDALRAVKNGTLLKRVVILKNMPPPDKPEASQTLPEEREKIHQWILSVTGGSKRDGATGGGAPETSSSSPWGRFAAVEKCIGCHGALGISPNEHLGYPHLAGQSAAYLGQQINDFRSNRRLDFISGSQAMNAVAQSLTEEELKAVVDYYSRMPLVHDESASAGDKDTHQGTAEELTARIESGKALAVRWACLTCHVGQNSLSPNITQWPRIVGQSPFYISQQLQGLLQHKRTNAPTMSGVIENIQENSPLSDEDLKNIGLYFRHFSAEP